MAENNVIKVIFEAVTGNLDKALDDTSNRFKNLGGVVKGFGVAMGAATVAAGAAAVKLGKDVVSAYADYEQLVGGVDTLFKESSQAVQEYANNAFKTAGLSANQYMKTVTGFSASLISSLGGDTAKAAQAADMAVTDMADNANKMGTGIDMIQNAYQGFAKQNYTMLDNLKLGYGGTKTEMERLLADAEKLSGIKYDISSFSDIANAIHVIQDEMEITGTTAKEASDTISGSMSSTKSAIDNLIAGLGNADADIGSLVGNVVDSFENVVKNIIPVIENIIAALPQAMPVIIEGIKNILPTLLETFKSLFTQVLNMLISLLPELIPFAVDIIMTLVNAIIDNLPMIVTAAVQLIIALAQGIGEALPELIPAVIQALAVILDNIIRNLPMVIAAGADIVMGLIKGIINTIPALISGVVSMCVAMLDALLSFFGISSPSKVFMQIGVDLITGLINGLKSMLSSLLSTVTSIASSVLDGFKSIASKTVQIGKDIVSGIWKGISGAASWLKTQVSNFGDGIVSKARSVFKINSPSKVFAEIGKSLAEGLGVGFIGEMAKVSKAMGDAVPKKFDIPGIRANGKILPKAESAENDEGIQTLMGRLGSDEFGHYDTEEQWRRSQIALAEAREDDKAKKGFTEGLLFMMKEKLSALMGLEPYLNGADERNILESAKNKLLTEIVNLTNEMKGSLQEMAGSFNTPSQFTPLTEYAYSTGGNGTFTRVINTPTLNMYLTIKDLDSKSADEVRDKANIFAGSVLGKDENVALGWRDVLRNH